VYRERRLTASEIVEQMRSRILEVAQRHGATNVRIFGSVARGQADEASDIDLLVDLEAGKTLFDLVALTQELSEITGRRVDVVTERGLRKRIHDSVMREAIAL
jgi:predicted nucleotidyltransferase